MMFTTRFAFSVSMGNQVLDGLNLAKKKDGGQDGRADGRCGVVISRVLLYFSEHVPSEPVLLDSQGT